MGETERPLRVMADSNIIIAGVTSFHFFLDRAGLSRDAPRLPARCYYLGMFKVS